MPLSEVASIIDILVMLLGIVPEGIKLSSGSISYETNFWSHPSTTTESSHTLIDNFVQSCIEVNVE